MNKCETLNINYEHTQNFSNFELPSNFDNLNFPDKLDIVKATTRKIIQHLYANNLGPLMNGADFFDVITGLIANSIDATKGIKRNIQIEARIMEKSDKPKIIIEILDNGSGFSIDKLDHNLSKPIGSTKTCQGNLGGQGSGLYVYNSLIKKVEGKISYGNREEGGAFVKLILPIFKNNNVLNQTIYRIK